MQYVINTCDLETKKRANTETIINTQEGGV